eukprot:gene6811-9327_t
MYCGPGGVDVGALVADIGSFATRIGFAGDDLPKAYFPSAIGVINNDRTIEEPSVVKTENDYFFDISKYRSNMAICCPVQDGLVADWDLLEKIWDYSLTNCLKVDMKNTPVLAMEKPYNSPVARQKLTEFMFETYNIPAFFLAKDSVLSCYACGKTSGLVVDFGSSGTVISPVVDGWVDMKGLNRSLIGGRLLDSYVSTLIKKSVQTRMYSSTSNISNNYNYLRPNFRIIKKVNVDSPKGISVTDNTELGTVHKSYDSYMNLELSRDFKESVSRMADSTVIDTDPRFTNIPLIPYELPDGTVVDVGIERFQLPELFIDSSPLLNNNIYVNNIINNQDFINMTYHYNKELEPIKPLPGSMESLPKLILESILRSDHDQYSVLASNIVLTGGGSCFDGISDRLKLSLDQLIHTTAPSWKVKLTSLNENERMLCPWLGGSILASLDSFHEMWISKQEYEEFGSLVVDRKCP